MFSKCKLNEKFYSYAILALQLVFSSWSWLFLFFSAFTLVNATYGGLISAILFLTNSAVRMFGGKYFSFITKRFDEHTRLCFSVAIKVIFIFLLIFLPYIGDEPILLVLWSLVVNIFLVLDGYLSFHIKYIFADLSHISLMRYNTLSNLGSRGSIAVVSIIAFSIEKNNWNLLTVICMLLGFSGFLASYLSLIYVDKHREKIAGIKSTKSSLEVETPDEAVLLGAHFIFLMNLFFGSANLLLARAIPEYGLALNNGVNIITFFYVGFICVNIFGYLFDQMIDIFITWKNLIISYYMMTIVGSFFYFFCFRSDVCFLLAIIWGGYLRMESFSIFFVNIKTD